MTTNKTLTVACGLFLISCWLFTHLLSAQAIQFGGGNTAEYWLFVDTLKEHIEDKLKLSFTYNNLTLRGLFFFWQPSLPNQRRLQYIDYNIEYVQEVIDIIYGTYYTTFGRGLVLNQFLDEDFRTDNSIYGAKATLKMFHSELSALFGRPRNIFFEENAYKIKNDTSDQIRGINLESKLPTPEIITVNIGGRYVRYNRRIDLTPRAFTELLGGNIEFAMGPYQGYFEYARQLSSYPGIGGRLTGNGILFSSNLTFSGLGLFFQIMDYDSIGFGGLGYRYNEPPTPIKSGISVNRGINEFGFGTSINYSPFDYLSLEGNYNTLKTHDKTEGILEQILKIKFNVGENLEVNGMIERNVKDKIELPILKKTELKPSLEATYNFNAFFLDAGYEHNFISADSSKYFEHALSVSIGKSELFQLTLRYERRNRIPNWLLSKLGVEKHWPMAELSLDITNKHNLRVRIGSEKGGLVCSGGVCRFEAPFKGVKIVLTSIF
ncbi:MAG: DUF6029 family protein [candidate division WOR-3 bacterium]|nr:DUF6029 family protein [candidate division WOR-3 bacterium]